MANWYVWSGATGGATGADWANAYLTIKAAAEAAGTVAGDSIWVAHDHAETTAAALSITSKNTRTAPGTIACVNRAGSVPPVAADLATTATVTTTGASTLTLTGQGDGPTYWYGISFACGTGAVGSVISLSASTVQYFKNCKLRKLGTTFAVNAIDFAGERITLDNTTIELGAVGDVLRHTGGKLEWINTPGALAGAIVPTTLFTVTSTGTEDVMVHGVDLSAVTTTLVPSMTSTAQRVYRFSNCKIAAGVVPSTAQAGPGGASVVLVNCDSGATNYRTEKYAFGGNQTTETTIVRTGGASDGTTPISWRIATDANPRWQIPYESLPISVWNDSPGAHTVSIYGYWNNASSPNNDDIWIDVEGLTTGGFPISSIVGSGKSSFLANNAAIPTDGSTWGGGAGNTKFKMSAGLMTAMKGPINVAVKAAKASSTFYIDPKIEVI